MNPTEILDWIGKYGISTALLVWLIYKIFLWFDLYFKAKLAANQPKEPVETKMANKLVFDFQINTILTQALFELECASVAVCQFHNGGATLDGVPFYKFSVTHMKSLNTLNLASLQNLPTSLFAGVIRDLLKDRFVRADMNTSSSNVQSMLAENGHKLAFLHVIQGENGVIGYISVGYSGEEFHPRIRELLGAYSGKIGIQIDRMAREAK